MTTAGKPITTPPLLPEQIVLSSYTPLAQREGRATSYQSEMSLELKLLQDLQELGYRYAKDLHTTQALLENCRRQLEALNAVRFTSEEWQRFTNEYLDVYSEDSKQRSRKLQLDDRFDFEFDDGQRQNICLVDKEDFSRNVLQVVHQVEQMGSDRNIYDVSILVNGLPLVHIELKRRGVSLREAFNQVHRYSRESFSSSLSLYKYVQLFVISNGTETRYFANSLGRNRGSYGFTSYWASRDNQPIRDLEDFTATFFKPEVLLQVLFRYSLLYKGDDLHVLRPYQIAATESILHRLVDSYHKGVHSSAEAGGYIWHTTGSGKTLTSYLTARLATKLPFLRKVLFVVDRKDLDNQTVAEFMKYDEESVFRSQSTTKLKQHLTKSDSRIVVTTLQKLNHLLRKEKNLALYHEPVLFIFDECHRSQFGKAQQNIRRRFRHYYQFGFTGTPIFVKNAGNPEETTQRVFGEELHAYVLTDAIRDEKVLRFKVDYTNVRQEDREAERLLDDACEELPPNQGETASSASSSPSGGGGKAVSKWQEEKALLLHPERIHAVSDYLLKIFRLKTRRSEGIPHRFNALFAVSSIEAAQLYYDTLQGLQKEARHPLKIATIFSYVANEVPSVKGEIAEENLAPTLSDKAFSETNKEFLKRAISDYNTLFGCSFSIQDFSGYYQNLSDRVKRGEVDLLIVVGMFLTGFDAQCINTLFVDKSLRYHGLLQAFSRTNRIWDETKPFGNIVTFCDLEQRTEEALSLFGRGSTRQEILVRSFDDYLEGFTDLITNKEQIGYLEVVQKLQEQYPLDEDSTPVTDKEKRAYARLFGEFLQLESKLENFDEYNLLKELNRIHTDNLQAVESFKELHSLSDTEVDKLKGINYLDPRSVQDYRSIYIAIMDEQKANRSRKTPIAVDWEDVTFEVALIHSQEYSLDTILALIYQYNRDEYSPEQLQEEVSRLLRATIDLRGKESLIQEFLAESDLSNLESVEAVQEDFYRFASAKRKQEIEILIEQFNLKREAAQVYLQNALDKGEVSRKGNDLSNILPPSERGFLDTLANDMQAQLYETIERFVNRYKGIKHTLE